MTPITSQASDPYMPVSGMIVRRTTTCFRSRFLRLLHAGSDPLEADIVQTEVLGIGTQEHAGLGDVKARIEFLPLGHDLTLEAGLQFARRPNSTISPLATSFLAMSAARLSTEATSM